MDQGVVVAPRPHYMMPRMSRPSMSMHQDSTKLGNTGGYVPRQRGPNAAMGEGFAFDGKRMRLKAGMRKTVDYNCSLLRYVENRLWQRDYRDRPSIQADELYLGEMLPPPGYLDIPMNCVTTKFVRTSTNKIRCPIFCVCWTPEGRRLVTGASSGEFTLWNGLTFNFETILQAHDTSVRTMRWSNNDQWMLTADHGGFVKYWQSNMNNVKMYQAHKDPVRDLSFCPTDQKFASCSDDGTVRIWDFLRCHEERILRGHGADVKCVDWHPQKALVASGSKDAQQPLKLWDPRMGNSLATIHAHKNTVMQLKWNRNGNWLLTASRDHLLKLFDVRNMKEEIQSFKGHKKEATAISWHPIHEGLFASGGSDGAIMFWMVGNEKEVGSIDEAHDMMVWSLSWHPLGHILASGSNDHTTKFWTRNRPGDSMRDEYNLNLPMMGMPDDATEYDGDYGNMPSLPGIGLENNGELDPAKMLPLPSSDKKEIDIPGLEIAGNTGEIGQLLDKGARGRSRKIPFAKPVPRDFETAWMEGKQPEIIAREAQVVGNGLNDKKDAGIRMQSPEKQNFRGAPGMRGRGFEQMGNAAQRGPRPSSAWNQQNTGATTLLRPTGPSDMRFQLQSNMAPRMNPLLNSGAGAGRGAFLDQDMRPVGSKNDNQQNNGSGAPGGAGASRGPPSLLDMPMSGPTQKRTWEDGPGQQDAKQTQAPLPQSQHQQQAAQQQQSQMSWAQNKNAEEDSVGHSFEHGGLDRSGPSSDRGGFGRGGPSSDRGGFGRSGGSSDRGGFGRGGGGSERGGFGRGGGSSDRGGFGRGGGSSERGGFGRGGGSSDRGGFGRGDVTSDRGGFGRGGVSSEHGGFGRGGLGSERGGLSHSVLSSEHGGMGRGGQNSERGAMGRGGQISERGGMGRGGHSNEHGGFGSGGQSSEQGTLGHAGDIGGPVRGGHATELGGRGRGGHGSEFGGMGRGGHGNDYGGLGRGGHGNEQSGMGRGGHGDELGGMGRGGPPSFRGSPVRGRGLGGGRWMGARGRGR